MCFILSAVFTAAAAQASAGNGTAVLAGTSVVSSQDRTFMAAAAQANIAEISISSNVVQRVAEPLDSVAARYVTDHTAALAQLRKLAAGLGVGLPNSPSSQQLSEAGQIESQSGRNLNVAFARASVIAHEQAIALFKQESSLGSNAQVKAYASDAMPMLNMHLDLAEQAATELGVSVSKTPVGAPQTGSGSTSGTQQVWLFALGGVALLAGVGVIFFRKKIPYLA
jgi:putative membrane protein